MHRGASFEDFQFRELVLERGLVLCDFDLNTEASGSGHAVADEENRRLETTSTNESTTRGAAYRRMSDPFEE